MRRALSAMTLQAPGEVDKVYFPLQSPQPLAAYYAPFPGYGPYLSALGAEEDPVQPFPPLSASQTVAPLNPFGVAPPLLSPGLAEPLYSVPWYNKLSPWYPLPHIPREMPHLVSSPDYPRGSPGSRDVVPVGNSSHGGLQWEPETLFLPPPSHFIPAPQLLNGEEKLPGGRRFDFTEEDLRFVLYGVVANLEHPARLQHAVSGVLVPFDCSGLCLMQTMFGEAPHLGVFCCSFIAKGIRFGPFQGKVVNASEVKTHRDNSRMWEIFEDGHLSHFIDGKGSGNWMSYVNCARFPKEQNLVAVQFQGQIFYESCKEVYENQELLVWYGSCYEKFLDIPTSLQIMERGKQLSGPSDESAEGYRCERCGKVFTYSYYRDKHLKYTPCVDKGDRKFPCSLCKRSFEKRDRLRIHILHVHEKHRPYLCSICGKCFSQSSSLNKHMRVHSGDRPYQCVYCTKKFTASSILRTHIRQHSGEKPFKCKYCGKSFASHAAHDSHVRRSHKEGDCLTCSTCGKSFLGQEDFYSHMKFHKDC